MFIDKDTPRKSQDLNCIYDDPEMSKVTVSIAPARNGTNRNDVDKYPPVTYTHDSLVNVKLKGGYPIYWAHLVSKTLADKWHPISTPVADMKIDDAEQYAIAYCSILTGKECVVTKTTEPRITKVDGVDVKWADEKVHRVLKRAQKMTVRPRYVQFYARTMLIARLLARNRDRTRSRRSTRCLGGRGHGV